MKKRSFYASLLLLVHLHVLHASEWGYNPENGPKQWGGLNSKWSLCATGQEQSPINIIESGQIKKVKNELKAMYVANSKEIINNGHTVQVNFDHGSSIAFKDMPYHLLQFHFHTPSENHIQGIAYPLEIHMVHQNDKKELLVISVLVSESTHKNKNLEKIISSLPQNKTPQSFKNFNPQLLMPTSKGYYQFQGSLTTPPCSENVTWIVFKDPIEAHKTQIEAIHALTHNNARDIQPLGNRIVNATED